MATTDTYNRKSAMVDLKKFNFSGNDSDYMEVTEWKNGDGYTVSIGAGYRNVLFDITNEEIDALNYLVNAVHYDLGQNNAI